MWEEKIHARHRRESSEKKRGKGEKAGGMISMVEEMRRFVKEIKE